MRTVIVPALLALALLGGCNSAEQSGQTPAASQAPVANPAPAQPANVITGTVALHDQIQIGAGAQLDIKLVDIAQPQIPIAEKTETVSGQPPYTFNLEFDPSKIDQTRTYVVNVTMTDGPRHFIPALNSPVLTRGNGRSTQVVLNAEPTAAEKLEDAYDKLQAHIGGMRKVEGTYTTDKSSVGWDAFVEGGKVVFARVNTDLDAGGHTSVKYAYKDGKPMAVVKMDSGVTERVGWDANGQVLLNKKSGGGTVADDEAKSLYDDAGKALQMAQARADATRRH